ncbi:MAG TPA: tetratricopeptide repeat protein [Bacteroides sp.]|nr:tetratricopeptide repeat protein [Bacteroides sp.]
MPGSPNKLIRFFREIVRRKVLHFLIVYVTACFAIIEFFDITSGRFTIPEKTFDLLYILAAAGIPVVIILPWYIYRKQKDTSEIEPAPALKSPPGKEKILLHNLPVQLTSFIGREQEMETIRELISEHRLVTLTGAGGCGKTRLACEVAAQLVPGFKEGVWFVDLAPISDGNLVGKEILEVLGIPEVPNQPIIKTLVDQIRDHQMLIILDNCEHLVRPSAETTTKLLQSVPGLRMLVTSREALNNKGEHVWRIPSLTLIDPEKVVGVESARDSEAVLLFTDRARMKNPNFKLEKENVTDIVSICNKLDGIPLAVELVASRTMHMDPGMILERFADRFDRLSSHDPEISTRQKTLQATIEWSYNLLSDHEKILFARLAVFNGGFGLKAAEKVCSDERLPEETVLDTLSRLVDRSLVFTFEAADHSMRYNMLETIRQFALNSLQSNKEDEQTRKSHLLYFLGIAEEAYDQQFDKQLMWAKKLNAEHDNILAALNWAEIHSPEKFVKLSGTLYWFWRHNAHLIVGKEYLEKARSKGTDGSEDDARVVLGLGMLNWVSGNGATAIRLMEESLVIWRRLNNLKEEAVALSEISEPLLHSGDIKTSLKYSERGLEIARKLGDPGLINHCLIYLCTMFVHTKQYEQGQPLVEELLDSSEKLQNLYGIESAIHLLGDCTLGLNNYREAEKRYALGIQTGLKYGNMIYTVFDLQGVAFALSGQSRWAKSIRLDTAAREKMKMIGMTVDGMVGFWDEWIARYIEGAKKEVGEELTRKYQEEGIAMGFEKAVEYALDFEKD